MTLNAQPSRNAPGILPPPDGSAYWEHGQVEAALVEALQHWHRMPGSGGSPFAADGPWHLIVPDWNDWGAHDREAPMPRIPLTRDQVTRMQTVSTWIMFVPERDRRLVVLAIRQLAAGAKRIDWIKIRKPMGVPLGADGLRKRYSRAITSICARLNGAPSAKSGRTSAASPAQSLGQRVKP